MGKLEEHHIGTDNEEGEAEEGETGEIEETGVRTSARDDSPVQQTSQRLQSHHRLVLAVEEAALVVARPEMPNHERAKGTRRSKLRFALSVRRLWCTILLRRVIIGLAISVP